MWDRFYNGDQPRADKVRAMLTRKIQEETLRTYLFTYSNVYDSVSMVTMSELFELSVGDVHSIVSKMIINAELMVGPLERRRGWRRLCVLGHVGRESWTRVDR